MPAFWRDLRLAARSLSKTPALASIAVLGFALGIGSGTAIFSVVKAVLLKPLAYREPDRLVVVLHEGVFPVSPADYFDYQRLNRSFTATGAAQAWSANLSGGGAPERIGGISVSPEIFPLLGVEPILGRTFSAGDDKPGRAHQLVLSHGFWQRRFGGNRQVIGRTVTLDGAAWEIAGVMPPSFRFTPFWITNANVWTPLDLSARLADRAGRSLRVFARLKPGVAADRAQADLGAIGSELARQYPDTNARLSIRVTPLAEKVSGPVRPVLLVMLGTVVLLLLISCANAAGLILARSASRGREIAVRLAVGAGRADLLRHLIAESLVLSLAGGAAGLLLARWGVAALLATLPPRELPRGDEVAIDSWVLVFAIGVSVLAGVAAGLAPAARAVRLNLFDALRDGARGSSGGLAQARARRWLTAAEVALAVVLLAGAGLLIKSFLQLRGLTPGFEAGNLLSFEVSTGGTVRDDKPRRAPFYQEVLDRVRQMPGVEAAGGTNHVPLAGDIWFLSFQIEGRAIAVSELPSAVYRVATPGYFAAMGVHLLRGRDFALADHPNAPGVAVINETMARRHWPGEDALGRRVALGSGRNPEWRTIVGIVSDLKQSNWSADAVPEIFLPLAQQSAEVQGYFTIIVRTRADPAALEATARRAVSSVEPNAVVSRVLPMEKAIAGQLWRARVSMLLLAAFAAVALALAAAGVYGVIAHSVAQRTQEIGIRVALGARPAELLRMIVLDGMRYVWAGLAAGLALALAGSSFLEKLLFRVPPADPAAYVLASAALAVVALAANLIPARRAMRVDPMTALRH